ncbi:MAG: hypothetical protein SNJ52_04690 [Verrucomicrobiia bacterium]
MRKSKSPGVREAASVQQPWQNRADIALALVAFAAILYGLIHLAWVSNTSLGRVPLLDAKENIDLARSLVAGTLPDEPFYRAMGYPLTLAIPAALGLSDADLMLFAGVLGLLAHAAASVAVGWMGWRLSGRLLGLWISGLLFALYPVAIYFSAEVLDTSLSTALLLWGVVCLTIPGRSSALLAGFFLAAAVLVRPHALTLLVGAPVLAFFCLWKDASPRVRGVRLLCVFAGALPLVVAYGTWQLMVGGQFGILPWQGAYNLWKGNMPGASGKYLAQSMLLDSAELLDVQGHVRNPARVESERLFAMETGDESKDIGAMNRYWRQRLISSVLEEPGAWIALMGRKVLYLVNDYEQYNNKTYLFQKSLAPALSWNPLGFGMAFVLAVMGMTLAWSRSRSAAFWLLAVGLLYGAGVWLFFAGDRFRFPLAAFCIAGASGLAFLPGIIRAGQWRGFIRGSLAGGIAALLTFPAWAGARDSGTFVQDRMLLAAAAALDGQDAEALRWGREALETLGPRADVARIIIQSSYNAHLTGALSLEQRSEWEALRELAQAIPAKTGRDTFLFGVLQWKCGDQEEAKKVWRNLFDSGPMTSAGVDAGALLQILEGDSLGGDLPQTTWLAEAAATLRKGSVLPDNKMALLRRLLEVPPD